MEVIGIKILDKKPEGIEHIEKKTTCCNMVAQARQGKIFYTTNQDYSCALARWNLGLQKRNDTFKTTTAEYLVKNNNAVNIQIALKFLSSLAVLEEAKKFFVYFPFNDNQENDLLIYIGKPNEIMQIVRERTKETGEKHNVNLGGVGAVCGEIIATCLSKRIINLSLGCCGARSWGRLRDEELILGIPK